jgi:pimeloyl-ACP methyl ester carboxylesterase
MRSSCAPRTLLFALLFVAAGVALAAWVQTDGAVIRVDDVRFADAHGRTMSALLYAPAQATPDTPAPAVLAVHGYINSRETQSPFAIELARRGYVVLALDQAGHGFSAPAAFAGGFGGPSGLSYLRSLPFVDRDRIGLEGHSMGGWAVLSAAAAIPDGYRAMVLVGSAPGVFGAPEGTADFPRNVAIVFGRWDEFSELMWGVRRGLDVVSSGKLQRLFATTDDVVEGRRYGDVEAGTARRLDVPATTHPGEHLSVDAVARALDWFDATIGTPMPRDDQVWYWKEAGTLTALLGAIVAMIAAAVYAASALGYRAIEPVAGGWTRRRIAAAAVTTIAPVVTYFPCFLAADAFLPANALWPQQVTNGLMVWLIVNGAIAAAALTALGGWRALRFERVGAAAFVGTAGVATVYAVLALAGALATVDFRFWIVAVKPLTPWHVPALLAYLPVLVLYFVVAGTAAVPFAAGPSTTRAAIRLAALTCGGFAALLVAQYVPLFADRPLPLGQPLFTIIAYQFLVLLGIVGATTAVLYRATDSVLPGAFVNALFVGWVVVAGTATHVG